MGVLFCCIRPRVDEDDDFVPNEAIRTANNRSGDDSTSSLLRDISNRSDEVLPRGATDDKRLRSYSHVGPQPKPQARQEPQPQPQQERVLVSEPKQEQEPKPQEPKPQEQEPKPQEPKPQEQQEPQPQQQQERVLISEPKQEQESKPQEPKPQQQEQEGNLVSEPTQEQEPKSQEQPKPQELQEHVLVSEPKQEPILERHEPEQEPKQIQGLVLKSEGLVIHKSIQRDQYVQHNKEECFICFEVYTTEQPRTRFKCSHYCHLGCILAWQEISALCPMCLEVLELDDEEEKSPRTIISSTNQA